jgi:hypothetical protein
MDARAVLQWRNAPPPPPPPCISACLHGQLEWVRVLWCAVLWLTGRGGEGRGVWVTQCAVLTGREVLSVGQLCVRCAGATSTTGPPWVCWGRCAGTALAIPPSLCATVPSTLCPLPSSTVFCTLYPPPLYAVLTYLGTRYRLSVSPRSLPVSGNPYYRDLVT